MNVETFPTQSKYLFDESITKLTFTLLEKFVDFDLHLTDSQTNRLFCCCENINFVILSSNKYLDCFGKVSTFISYWV